MILFKNDAATMNGVLKNQKHATNNNVHFKSDEIILIQQTMGSIISPTQKSIRWIMNYVRSYEDTKNESDHIWGRHWNYIIEGKDLRPVEGFDIKDIQASNKKYGAAEVHAYLLPEDEEAVLNWIGIVDPIEKENEDLAEEFNDYGTRNINEIITTLNDKYKEQPNYKSTVIRTLNRPTKLRDAVIERDGTKCKICKLEGFVKKNGLRYCEVHHMIELNNNAPHTMQSWNMIVVCPTCHKKLHYANVKSTLKDQQWEVTINGERYLI